MKPEFKTKSEELFAGYLDEHGYHWDYEGTNDGKAKVPDFRVQRDDHDFLCDVKERSPKAPPAGARHFDPIIGIRKLIESGRKKFKEYSNRLCVLVTYNNGDFDTRLDPTSIFGAMLGNPGFQMEIDPAAGRANPETTTNVYLQQGGRMVRHYKPFEPRESPNNLAAIVALTSLQIRNPEFDSVVAKQITSEEGRLDRRLSPGEKFAIRLKVLRSIRETLGEVTRVMVCENPLAHFVLPSNLFNGPFDERWAIVNGTTSQTFAGENLLGCGWNA
jgi:hypothetical protein